MNAKQNLLVKPGAGFRSFWVISTLTMLNAGLAYGAASISSVDFKQRDGKSVLEVRADQPLATFEKSTNESDKQIVIDVKGAKLTKGTARKLDTSSFDSKVMLVSPYQVGDDARIVLQLREAGDAEVASDGNTLRIEVPGGAAPYSVGSSDSASPAPLSNDTSVNAVASSSSPSAPVKKDLMDQYLDNREAKKFSGRPISLKLNNADVRDVLRLIGEASGFNLVISDEVNGNVTLSLEDVPWDQALDVVLQTRQLSAERSGNLLRISSIARFTSEKQQELQAKLIGQANAPFITRVFPINYAKTGELSSLIQNFLRGLRPAAAGAAPAVGIPAVLGVNIGVRDPVVQIDTRSNSLIIQDTAENTERARKIIELLDVQPSQVLIEGKIVEASESWGRQMQGRLGFQRPPTAASNITPSGYYVSGAAGDLSTALFGAAGAGAGGAGAAAFPPGGGVSGFGIQPAFGLIRGAALQAILSVAEQEDKVKVMASPRAVVMNQEAVNITSGQTVLLPTISQGAGGNLSAFVERTANLSMNVTPTVTNEGSIVLQLTLTRDVPIGNTVNPRNITTKVLVDSGSTLVLGGIYSEQENESSSGTPFLRKIPILGKLFGSEGTTKARSELFFFITPRILNAKDAGLSAG